MPDLDINDAALWAAEALDHWADQEDAKALSCPDADILTHREREGAYRDGAARFRKLIGGYRERH